MACPNESALLDFASGLLSDDAAEAIESHIDGCPDCRALVADAAREDLGSSSGPGAPGGPVAPQPYAKLGRYLVLEMLNAGGMGVVYAAFDPELERKVALKVLRPEALGAETATQAQSRLLREAQAMARLSHPNVATVFDVGTVGEQVFLAMELVDGGTLADWMAEGHRPWREVVDVFLAAGRGLAAAHAAGLVHRDFKPGNVLLGTDGRVRVTDFGLARPVVIDEAPPAAPAGVEQAEAGEKGERPASSLTGGTPAYMAPEQFQGGAVDARSDQFSYCVALWEALFGERPFGGKTFQEHRTEVLLGNLRGPPAAAGVPLWLVRVLERGLKVEPQARFPFMENLLDALGRSRRGDRALRWGVAGAGALLLALVVAAVQVGGGRAARCQPGSPDGMTPELSAKVDAARLAVEARCGKGGFGKAQETLAAYARALAQAQAELCAAPRPEAQVALVAGRERCLAERRGDLAALVEVMGEAKVGAEVAAEAFARLPSIGSCTSALQAELRWPAAGQVEEISTKLSRAEALRLVGGASDAIRLADEARTAALAAKLPPLAARALLTQNLAVLETVPDPMEPMLHEAAAAAEAAGEPLVAARAWAAVLAGLAARRDPEAVNAALHARAFLEAAGGDPAVASRIEAGRARAMASARLEGALDAAEEAVLLAESLPSSLARSNAYSVRAEVLCSLRRCADAVPDVAKAADALEAALGRGHRQTAAGLLELARLLRDGGEPAQARAPFERAKASAALAFGPRSPETALILTAMAQAELVAGDAAAAQQKAVEALEVQEAAAGKESPELAAILVVQARALRQQEGCEQALALLARAQQLARGLEDVDAVAHEEALCQLSLAKADLALAALERVYPSRRGSAAHGAILGRALWEKGERERARALMEDAAARGSGDAKDWLRTHPAEETAP